MSDRPSKNGFHEQTGLGNDYVHVNSYKRVVEANAELVKALKKAINELDRKSTLSERQAWAHNHRAIADKYEVKDV